MDGQLVTRTLDYMEDLNNAVKYYNILLQRS